MLLAPLLAADDPAFGVRWSKDAEGSECAILGASRRLLAVHRPVIVQVEVGGRTGPSWRRLACVEQLAREYNYSVSHRSRAVDAYMVRR